MTFLFKTFIFVHTIRFTNRRELFPDFLNVFPFKKNKNESKFNSTETQKPFHSLPFFRHSQIRNVIPPTLTQKTDTLRFYSATFALTIRRAFSGERVACESLRGISHVSCDTYDLIVSHFIYHTHVRDRI